MWFPGIGLRHGYPVLDGYVGSCPVLDQQDVVTWYWIKDM